MSSTTGLPHESRVVADVLQDERLPSCDDVRAVAVIEGHVPPATAAARGHGAEVGTGVRTGRHVQSGEELSVPVDEVDHGEGNIGYFGHLVRERVEAVERSTGPFPEPERPKPLGAHGGIAVDGSQQQPVAGASVHGWAPMVESGAGSEVALIRCWTRVTSAPVPEFAILASQGMTGTSGGRSSAARTSSGP